MELCRRGDPSLLHTCNTTEHQWGRKRCRERIPPTLRWHWRSQRIWGLNFLSTAVKFFLYFSPKISQASKHIQSKHMVNIFHSQVHRHSADLISCPTLKFQNHSEIAWSIFIHFVFLTLFMILMCYFNCWSVFSLIEVILSEWNFDLARVKTPA